MDANTELELEALKMEARAIEITDTDIEELTDARTGLPASKTEALADIAARIRALKTGDVVPGSVGVIIPGEYPMGMTVAELKALIRDWPETDKDDEPNGVWVDTGWCLSGPVIRALHLNGLENDLILESGAWDKKEADNG